METTKSEMDIKTVLSLIADGHIDSKSGFALVSDLCGIDHNRLVEAFKEGLPAKVLTRWTPFEENFILEAWNRGDSVSDISKHINRRPEAIRARLYNLRDNGRHMNRRSAVGRPRKVVVSQA